MRRKFWRKALPLLLCALLTLPVLTACHGSRGLDAFSIPDEFDESRTFEITFWAKNDTNKTQTRIYEKAIADFEALYRTSRSPAPYPLRQDYTK